MLLLFLFNPLQLNDSSIQMYRGKRHYLTLNGYSHFILVTNKVFPRSFEYSLLVTTLMVYGSLKMDPNQGAFVPRLRAPFI